MVDHFSWELDKYEVKKDVLGSLESVASKVFAFHLSHAAYMNPSRATIPLIPPHQCDSDVNTTVKSIKSNQIFISALQKRTSILAWFVVIIWLVFSFGYILINECFFLLIVDSSVQTC